jgi:hypothetical protein
MCCFAALGGLFGPRLGVLVWWLVDPGRWERTFSVFWWPLLGALFAPWTTLAYVLVHTGGIRNWEWALIAVAALVDASTLGGSSRSGKKRPKVPHDHYRQAY